MLARLHKVDAKVRHVMIVGHDPGMQGLALELAGDGDPALLQALSAKFPTAGLAVIRFKAPYVAEDCPRHRQARAVRNTQVPALTGPTPSQPPVPARLDLGRTPPLNQSHAPPDR